MNEGVMQNSWESLVCRPLKHVLGGGREEPLVPGCKYFDSNSILTKFFCFSEFNFESFNDL